MRVLTLGARAGRPVDAHGSRGFDVTGLGITAEAHLVTVRLRPGGVVGRHPAAARQLLVVLSGDAVVSGSHGDPVVLEPGQAAVWEPNELHETRSETGLVALLVEGDVDIASGERDDPSYA
ncbi:cupin domain-containing protein [Nocardioides dongkuii]|uniref:cupin domain-containing protein n=1 Tax=Nocardioides dongkuii TaxID=2760089 RepID=UPI0018778320|nr:cupin domain-containing protein [Nocardioides dongkuii]